MRECWEVFAWVFAQHCAHRPGTADRHLHTCSIAFGQGTVLIKSGAELEAYSKTEESQLEAVIQSIAAAGVRVVVAGSSFGEMAMHFIEKYSMMALKVPSKFELRRFCRATGATALIKLGAPAPNELGFARALEITEIGGTKCAVLTQVWQAN